ncbi:MAG: hypothetical protein RBS78_03985 [Coriobacteriia bacterium]|jgi:hypothetical protein|nr:hypothetical protein [Coriobacteriia bacterium]
MDALLGSRVISGMLVIALLAFMLVGQAAADALVPMTEKTATGRSVERAGFAYLTGVRTFAAAVMWNRLDGLFHTYYSGLPLDEQIYMMPTLNMVTLLDPQLTQPYYVASWILANHGELDEGLALAKRGVENNPSAGLLRVNYAQLLFLLTPDLDAAEEQAEAALGDVVWMDLLEQHDSYAVILPIFKKTGNDARIDYVTNELSRLDAEIDRLGLGVEHDDDHDHDHEH